MYIVSCTQMFIDNHSICAIHVNIDICKQMYADMDWCWIDLGARYLQIQTYE